ncbi:MAG: 4-hydroxy-3-methylbut-2-enyl diphosphate reductase [Armatimonadetes bacterium]|nr:4-hydroxy-3-methylbut-2-enyl diphosphate reductase [Armatimonadota bacterium]
MRVVTAREVGFCFGVKRAIHLTQQVLTENDEAFILGDLIHNKAATSGLEARGLRKVEHLSECRPGAPMVVRAHGLPAEQLQAAREAGLAVVDATCPIVRKAQEAAQKLEARGCQVVVVGDANHPEIKGILGNLKDPGCHLVVDSPEEVREARRERRLSRRVGVVFQTTHSVEQCRDIIAELMEVAREVQIINTICRPVRHRQLDAARLASQVDVMLVVGSAKSANTRELTNLMRRHNPNTLQIENAEGLDPGRFTGAETVGIASGLSTPEGIVADVHQRLLDAFPPGRSGGCDCE